MESEKCKGRGQGMFLTVNLKEQLLPGTFEYMLDELTGGKTGANVFDANYRKYLLGRLRTARNWA